MTPEQRETARQVRRDRRATALTEPRTEPTRQQQTDCQVHTEAQPTINATTLEIDHPDVIQRVQQFHRTLSDLQNIFCELCKERFPMIKTNQLSICSRCQTDSQHPKLFTLENNMDPGPVPTELCVSCVEQSTHPTITTCYSYNIYI